MVNVKGYDKLTDQQKDLFDQTYKAHLSAMGSEMRKKHSEDRIKEIKWDSTEKCIKVFFDNGEWYHYSLAEEWD